MPAPSLHQLGAERGPGSGFLSALLLRVQAGSFPGLLSLALVWGDKAECLGQAGGQRKRQGVSG